MEGINSETEQDEINLDAQEEEIVDEVPDDAEPADDVDFDLTRLDVENGESEKASAAEKKKKKKKKKDKKKRKKRKRDKKDFCGDNVDDVDDHDDVPDNNVISRKKKKCLTLAKVNQMMIY